MNDSDPPNKEPVVQFPDYDSACPPLQRCPACGAIGLPERLAVHRCPDTPTPDPSTYPQNPRLTPHPARSESRDVRTVTIQRCAEALQAITGVQATDICTDNPHVEYPVVEVVVGPDYHLVSPRILRTLAAHHCGLHGLQARQHPQSWVLEAVCPPLEESATSATSTPR